MNQAPFYRKPIANISDNKTDPTHWQTVLQTYDSGKYKEAIIENLNYIDKEVVKSMGNAGLTEFVIPHGSIRLTLTIKDGKFKVTAPFLKINEKNAIPIMRQVAEINFSVLILSKIILKEDNKLYFEYNNPIELSEPYKVYGILKEICNNADYYDDVFVEKYGAERLTEIQSKKYTQAEMDEAWSMYGKILREGLEYAAFFESKRWFYFAWDSMANSLLKLDYVLSPQGYLKGELENSVATLYVQEGIEDINAKVKEKIGKLMEVDKKKFEECMYMPNFLIPVKYNTNFSVLQEYAQKSYDRAKSEYGSSNYLGAFYTLLYQIYNTFYRDSIPFYAAKLLNESLEAAGGKPWKDAATILLSAYDKIMGSKTEEDFINLVSPSKSSGETSGFAKKIGKFFGF